MPSKLCESDGEIAFLVRFVFQMGCAKEVSAAGDCSFVHAAATVWNALPVTVTSKDSLLTFKAALKTHFCALAYM